jgi:hypothetical protein
MVLKSFRNEIRMEVKKMGQKRGSRKWGANSLIAKTQKW